MLTFLLADKMKCSGQSGAGSILQSTVPASGGCLARWVLMIAGIMTLVCGMAFGQEAGGIRGMVYDQDFEAPLAAATVSIVETGQKVVGTDQGNFVFTEVAAGTYTLVFAKQGFTRKVVADVVVSPGQMTEVEAWLSGDITEMEEFIVQDLRIGGGSEAGLLMLRMEAPALIDSVGADLIGQAGAGDAASALKLVSGATVQDGKYAVVRGLPDRYVNSQMNGVRLPTADADKRAVQLDQFPSALVESIQVSKTFMPDQQGDASGGAVNVILKTVPDERIIELKLSTGGNSQTTFTDNFLTYHGSRMDYWGMSRGSRRDLPLDVKYSFERIETSRFELFSPPPTYFDYSRYDERERQATKFMPVMSTQAGDADFDHKWQLTLGDRYTVADGIDFGVLGSFFYSRDYEHYSEGINDKRLGDVDRNAFVYHGTDTGDRYELYDVTRSKVSVLWGGLLSLGVETEYHALSFTYMGTQSADDIAMLMEDTRSMALELNSADALYRNETLNYTERSTSTLQLRGRHTIPIPLLELGQAWQFLDPEFTWMAAFSNATMWQPDFRGVIGKWTPDNPDYIFNGQGQWEQINRSGGYVGKRIWRDIKEESDQFKLGIRLPFVQWSGEEGFLEFGWFRDEVSRTYEQDSYSYIHGPGTTPYRAFDGAFYTSSFSWVFSNPEAVGYEGMDFDGGSFFALHNEMPWQMVRTGEDADYEGEQQIEAWYWMGDMPLTKWLKVLGGVRTESTVLETKFEASDGETLYLFEWDAGLLEGKRYAPDEWSRADAKIERVDHLPGVAMELEPLEGLKFQAAYSETIARPTFKEISPILQIDYVGSDQFVGNNNLDMSELTNYDLRLTYFPLPGTFLSVSYFYKDILDPIEYSTVVIAQTPYIQPFNFPEGWLEGYEFEARQDMSFFTRWLEGVNLRVNATFIQSEVTVPETLPDTTSGLAGRALGSNGATVPDHRDMKGAPEFLMNASLSYNIRRTGTLLTLFYTKKGDTLVAGEGVWDGYSPNIYEKQFDELGIGISQKLGQNWSVSFRAKNLTNPRIQTVYRSEYISGEAVRTSYKKGIDYSLSLTGRF